jgi:hypothetical protein
VPPPSSRLRPGLEQAEWSSGRTRRAAGDRSSSPAVSKSKAQASSTAKPEPESESAESLEARSAKRKGWFEKEQP